MYWISCELGGSTVTFTLFLDGYTDTLISRSRERLDLEGRPPRVIGGTGGTGVMIEQQ